MAHLNGKERKWFAAMCAFDCFKTTSLLLLTADLSSDPAGFWQSQLPAQYSIHTSLIDLVAMAALRVSLLCAIYVGTTGGERRVALSVSYLSFRLLTLVGSIFLAIKLAFFDYHSLGGAATGSAVVMIAGSLLALWVESVVPYVLTAARLDVSTEVAVADVALECRDHDGHGSACQHDEGTDGCGGSHYYAGKELLSREPLLRAAELPNVEGSQGKESGTTPTTQDPTIHTS
jgi:hypothetical protein